MMKDTRYEAERLKFNLVPECVSFMEWLATARRHDLRTYYIGAGLSGTLGDHAVAWKLKLMTWRLAVDGHIYLVQKKLGIDKYQFIAVKSGNPPDKRLLPFDYAAKGDHRRLYTVRSIDYGQN